MSISDIEEQILKYVWRGVVLAGLLTVLGSLLVPVSAVPASSPRLQQGIR